MDDIAGYLSKLPVFFIVGRGRSGSTLLRTILDAHPSIVIPHESRFVQYLYYQYGTIHRWTPDQAMQAVDFMEQSFEPIQINREFFINLILQEKEGLSFSSVCKAIYLSVQSEFNKEIITCIGDKNPRYSFFIPTLIRIFPEAKFIHLVRDYRDNLLAIKRVHKTIGEANWLPVILSRWKYYNQVIEKHKTRNAGRFFTLRFEDLIMEPEKTITQICEFLKLTYNSDMIHYLTRLNAGSHGNSYAILHKSLQHPFDKSKVGEWQTKLTSGQRTVCASLAGKPGLLYGYPTDHKENILLQNILVLLYSPVMLAGTMRYRLKALFYRFPFVMKIAYNLVLKCL